MDKDKSGSLSITELAYVLTSFNQGKRPPGPKIVEIFRAMDTNGDGSISEEEFVAGMTNFVTSTGLVDSHFPVNPNSKRVLMGYFTSAALQNSQIVSSNDSRSSLTTNNRLSTSRPQSTPQPSSQPTSRPQSIPRPLAPVEPITNVSFSQSREADLKIQLKQMYKEAGLGSRALTVNDLDSFLLNLTGHPVPPSQCLTLLHQMDSVDQKVSEEEFVRNIFYWFCHQPSSSEMLRTSLLDFFRSKRPDQLDLKDDGESKAQSLLKDLFKSIDQSRQGALSLDEIGFVLQSLSGQHPPSPEEIVSVFYSMDVNSSNQVDEEVFRSSLMGYLVSRGIVALPRLSASVQKGKSSFFTPFRSKKPSPVDTYSEDSNRAYSAQLKSICDLFSVIDADKSGFFELHELKNTIKTINNGTPVSDPVAGMIYSVLDQDQDGLISLQDFTTSLVTWLRTQHQTQVQKISKAILKSFFDYIGTHGSLYPSEAGPDTSRISLSMTGSINAAADMARMIASVQYGELGQMSLLVSPFNDWNREELVRVLLREGFEFRGEQLIPLSSFRETAEDHFKGKPIPPKPEPYTHAELRKISKLVRFLQNWFYEKNFEAGVQSALILKSLQDFEYGKSNLETQFSEVDQNAAEREIHYDAFLSDFTNKITRPHQFKRHQQSDPENGLMLDPQQRDLTVEEMALVDASYLETPLTELNWERAVEFARSVRPCASGGHEIPFNMMHTTTGRHCPLGGVGEQCDIFNEGKYSEFSAFGPGVTNFFKFEKWTIWMFFVLCILYIPPLIINIMAENSNLFGTTALIRTTDANLESLLANTTSVTSFHIPFCQNYGGYSVNCNLSLSHLFVYYSGLNIFSSIVLFIAYLWLRFFESYETRKLTQKLFVPSRYTLLVENIPSTITEKKLGSFLQQILFPYLIVNNWRPFDIAEVHFAYDFSDEYQAAKSRGDLIRRKRKLVEEHRIFATKLSQSTLPTDFGTGTLSDELAGQGDITFNQRVRLMRAVSLRNGSSIAEDRKALFRSLLNIDMEIDSHQTDLRSHSIGIKEESERPTPVLAFVTFNDDLATSILLKLFQDSNTRKCCSREKDKFVVDGVKLHLERAPEPETIVWENLQKGRINRRVRLIPSILLCFGWLAITLSFFYIASKRYQTFVDTKGSGLCPSDFDSLSQSAQQNMVSSDSSLLHCYCSLLSSSALSSDSLCSDYSQQQTLSESAVIVSAIVTLIMNILIEGTLNLGVHYFEAHKSSDHQLRSTFRRLFFFKFLNMGPMFLLQLNNIPIFSVDWYQSVGVIIILTQIGDILTSHAMKIFFRLRRRFRLSRIRRYPSDHMIFTQRDLNLALVDADFDFSSSYAHNLVTIFVSLMFATGIPLLLFLAFVSFIVMYFVNKYYFIRHSRSPSRLDPYNGQVATALIPYAIILHVLISLWSMEISSYFVSDDTLTQISVGSQSLEIKRIFPTLIFLILLALCQLSIELYNTCTGSLFFRHWKEDDQVSSSVSFSRALSRRLIKTLASYNMLMNPKYKELFNVSWKGASQMKRLSQVRLDTNAFGEQSSHGPSGLELGSMSNHGGNAGQASTLSPFSTHR